MIKIVLMPPIPLKNSLNLLQQSVKNPCVGSISKLWYYWLIICGRFLLLL